MDAVVDHLGLPGGEELHKDRSQAHPQDQKDHPADQIDEVAVGHYPVGLVGPVLPQPAGQQGVEAHAGAYAHGDHQGLDRVDKRQGYKPVGAELGHEHAVHQIIEGLDQLGQHHRRGDAQQDLPHTLRLKIAVIHSCLTHIRSPFLSHSKFRLPPGYEPQEPTHYDTISGKNFKGQNR